MGDAALALVLAQEEDSGNDLISVVPGLMIWTIITFVIVFFVLRKLAFGRIQGMIDERRDRIREALDEADRAREEARELIDEHKQRLGGEGRVGGDPRASLAASETHSASGCSRRPRPTSTDRLEKNRKAIEAENPGSASRSAATSSS